MHNSEVMGSTINLKVFGLQVFLKLFIEAQEEEELLENQEESEGKGVSRRKDIG